MKLLVGEQVWAELRRRARKSRSLLAAVSYVGAEPLAALGRLPPRTRIVADLSQAAVLQGRSSAKGALTLLDRGAQVLCLDRLHAKIYVFDSAAIVGSANLSLSSRDSLVEAAALLTAPEDVNRVRAAVLKLLRSRAATELPRAILEDLARREPVRRGPVGRGRRQRGGPGEWTLPDRVWLVPCLPDGDDSAAEGRAKREAASGQLDLDEALAGPRRFSWYNECGRRVRQGARDGDAVFRLS